MLLADMHDYRKGYKKHFVSYKHLKSENADVDSRRLLLIYSVECGLKYKLLDKWHIKDPRKILDGGDERKRAILTTHNLDKILKELGQEGIFKLPALKTIHSDLVPSEAYHQLYRYCIKIQEKGKDKEERLEDVLKDIASWIGEGM